MGYTFCGDFAQDKAFLDSTLRVGKTFDLRCREIADNGAGAVLYYIDGFVEEGQYEKILAFFQKNHAPEYDSIPYDVQINSTSIVSNGIATIPMAHYENNIRGAVIGASYHGIKIENGRVGIIAAESSDIKSSTGSWVPVVPSK